MYNDNYINQIILDYEKKVLNPVKKNYVEIKLLYNKTFFKFLYKSLLSKYELLYDHCSSVYNILLESYENENGNINYEKLQKIVTSFI